ncbi:MAG TPA: M14 family metallopeptidase [Candidatus Thermoplasmatota archaeon]
MRAPRATSLLLFALFIAQPALAGAAAALPAPLAPTESNNRPSFNDSWWDEYHATDDVYDLLREVAADHPDIVTLINIGTTHENRQLVVAKVSDNPSSDEEAEPKYLLMAATHAREWTTYHVAAYFLNWVTGNYRSAESGGPAYAAPGEEDEAAYASWLVDNRETYILAMVNPDGIEYSHTTDNLWRKNREPNMGALGQVCYGVDINRNFAYHWGEIQGDSHVPCSEVYAGPSTARTDGAYTLRGWRPGDPNPGGFTTAESIAIRDLQLRVPFSTALSLHSYSELVLYPWGYTDAPTVDHAYYVEMAERMAGWTGYTPLQGYDLYKTSGVWDDWSYAETGAFSFTIEMGTAFQPPAADIINQSQLLLTSLAFLGETADDLHLEAPNVTVEAAPRAEVDPNTPTPVTARVDAPNGVDGGSVTLVYTRNGGASWSEAPMRAAGGGEGAYVGSLPGLSPNTQAMYYVRVVDASGIVRTGPSSAPYSVFFVTAKGGFLAELGSVALLAVLGGAGAVGVLVYLRAFRGGSFSFRLPPVPRVGRRRPRRAAAAASPGFEPEAAPAPRRAKAAPVRPHPRPAASAAGPPGSDLSSYMESRPRLKRFLEDGEL